MDEKETAKKVEPEAPAVDTPTGVKAEKISLIEQAREENKKLEENLAKLAEQNLKLEENIAKSILGGKADAGAVEKEKEKELTPEEYAQNFRDGKMENPLK